MPCHYAALVLLFLFRHHLIELAFLITKIDLFAFGAENDEKNRCLSVFYSDFYESVRRRWGVLVILPDWRATVVSRNS